MTFDKEPAKKETPEASPKDRAEKLKPKVDEMYTKYRVFDGPGDRGDEGEWVDD